MQIKIDLTLEDIKGFLGENPLEVLKIIQNSVQLDLWLTALNDIRNPLLIIPKILAGDPVWIGYELMQLFNRFGHLKTIPIKLEEPIALKVGSTEEMIEFLQEVEKDVIKGRKNYWQEEYDYPPFLQVYIPTTLHEFLRSVKVECECEIAKGNTLWYVTHSLEISISLLEVLEK